MNVDGDRPENDDDTTSPPNDDGLLPEKLDGDLLENDDGERPVKTRHALTVVGNDGITTTLPFPPNTNN